ncbi:rRNA methylase [Treponema phagedenis]|uniref:RNA methyltransferase, TrmH family, group 1 n=1 Tax=Treponema phagedenis TaxID=162 RepID=A0A0B7GZE3_TREPH|nr:rRNA methylase [Treponema phagedenis]EFW36854.1 RNA methyltransferase, TrmH family, group 1 [Treponema phagedenis F0421]NVP24003.1 rRNA methylase [Treponema phagedenis]QEJ93866.1 rRNA methylase [Treponema phagedenis]QEJ99428.1 rRNA methylase [Treponema phagedenis]QEJ99791.1 rRNA methylase [Treponema phagedenis]
MLPIIIVLARPEKSKNIGSVCRAMANSDCAELRITGNASDYDQEEICRLAIHADNIWKTARFFEPSVEGLRQAVYDCAIVAGTTRRMGEKRKSWGMAPEQFASFAFEQGAGKAAIVFGNERTGLTDKELDICSLAINIPSAQNFPSLNLSHAVQIICYELFRKFSPRKYGYEKISMQEVTLLSEKINEYLCLAGLFRHAGKEDNQRFMEEIIGRAGMSKKEAARFEKLFKKLAYIKTKKE